MTQVSKQLGEALAQLVYHKVGYGAKKHTFEEYMRIIHPVIVALSTDLEEKSQAVEELKEEVEELQEEVDQINDVSLDIKIDDAMTIDKLEKQIQKLKNELKKHTRKRHLF